MSQSHCIPPSVLWLNRLSLFIIFFWFGALKVFSTSPAESLITHLHQLTVYKFISIQHFLMLLGFIECLIGVLWLIPAATKVVIIIFSLQMATTFLPLIIIPGETWRNIMILSLSGQYILKNIVLISSAFTIYKDCQVNGWSFDKISFASFFRPSRH